MLAWRTIAATDVPTLRTPTKMKPPTVRRRQALYAPSATGLRSGVDSALVFLHFRIYPRFRSDVFRLRTFAPADCELCTSRSLIVRCGEILTGCSQLRNRTMVLAYLNIGDTSDGVCPALCRYVQSILPRSSICSCNPLVNLPPLGRQPVLVNALHRKYDLSSFMRRTGQHFVRPPCLFEWEHAAHLCDQLSAIE